jgi:hypothetical protein
VRRPSAWPELSPRKSREASEDYEERAAVLEFDAGMSRADAEDAALRLVGKAYGTTGRLGCAR